MIDITFTVGAAKKRRKEKTSVEHVVLEFVAQLFSFFRLTLSFLGVSF